MKKLLSLSLICMFIFLVSSGCTTNQDDPEESAVENGQEQQLTALNHFGEYKLYAAELLPESRLLLTYRNNDTRTYQFRQYDFNTKTFISQSQEFDMRDFEIDTLRFLSDNFYVLSQNTCFVFDFACHLVKELSIPENISENFGTIRYWLSDDLQKIAYIKNPKLEAEYLYVSHSDGQEEKQIRRLEADLMIVDLFFSTDSNYLGFEGTTIPTGKDTSIDCYGYIDLNNAQTTLFPDDRTYMLHQADMMLICDKTAAYDAVRKGVVKTLDLKTKAKTEIVMDVAEECETANFGSDPSFLVGMHKEDTTYTITFTIYENGKKMSAVDYVCPSKQTYTDLISSGTQIRMDNAAQQILAFYYSTDQGGYTILSVPFGS